jgi:protocatechuate 3,4-dioxygenase beta subunit
MKKESLTWLLIILIAFGCKGQTGNNESRSNQKTENRIVGGGCDGCELMFVDLPKEINAMDTSVAWNEGKSQRLIVSGTVFQPGGKKPAADIIIYYWHTNSEGYYAADASTDPKSKSHGRLRGWVKTGKDGNYSIYTIRPAPYPNEDLPAHIHLSIKEPHIEDEYYTDDLVFDDDPLLIPYFKKYPPENRTGSGILKVILKDGIQIANHDIILGLNIPNYPTNR